MICHPRALFVILHVIFVIPDLIRDLPRTLFPRVVKRQALKMLISISMTDFMKYNEDVIPDLIRDLPRLSFAV